MNPRRAQIDITRKRALAAARARRWRERHPGVNAERCRQSKDRRDPTRWSAIAATIRPEDDLLTFAVLNDPGPRRGPRNYQRRTRAELEAARAPDTKEKVAEDARRMLAVARRP